MMNTSPPKVKTSSLRLLILTPGVDAPKRLPVVSAFLTKLTGSKPSADLNSFAGYTSHTPLSLKTRYYEAEVPIWCDELPLLGAESVQTEKGTIESNTAAELTQHELSSSDCNTTSTSSPTTQQESETTTTLSEWKDPMLSTSAHEVRQVIGSIILLLPLITVSTASPAQTNQQISQWIPYIETVTALRDTIEDETGREVASILVLQDTIPTTANISHTNKLQRTPETVLDNLEDECLSTHGIIGWDFVSWRPENTSTSTSDDHPSTRNEFGEKTGFERVVEVLERIDWFASSSTPDDDDETFNDDEDEIFHNDTNKNNDTLNFLTSDSQPFTSSSNRDSDLQREIMGLKMSMLDRESSDSPEVETRQTKSKPNDGFDDDFDFELASQSCKAGEHTGTDDVWADLDARDEINDYNHNHSTINGIGRNTTDIEVKTEVEIETEKSEFNTGDETQVSNLQSLMERVLAIREAGSNLNPSERRKFAKREVERIMRDLD